MGRNTFFSLKKPLKDRTNIVLTTKSIEVPEKVLIMRSIKEVLEYIKDKKEEVMIIGGASIYDQFLAHANKLLLTEIDSSNRFADAYFPEFDKKEYNKKVLSNHKDIETGINYNHSVYTKKKNN